MTIFIFIGSLLGVMALGVPIAYALLLSGVALMWHLGIFDAQILAQNVINGADSFPLLAVPFFMLAGEIMNVGVFPDASSTWRSSSSVIDAAVLATWPSSPRASWRRCRARPWQTPRRWLRCCSR